MTPIRHALLLFASLLLLGGLALGGQQGRKPRGLRAELGRAPSAATARANPFAGQPEAVLAGKKLFLRHCAECHGQDGQGQGKAPNLRSPLVQNAPPEALVRFLKDGNLRRGMPAWSHLPEERLWQVVSYLQSTEQ